MPADGKPGTVDRAKLASMMSRRLGLDEEWGPVTWAPKWFKDVADWPDFITHFNALLAAGCRWDVLLALLGGCLEYNQVVSSRRVTYDSWGEVERDPPMKDLPSPPGSEDRNRIRSAFNTTIRYLEDYEELVYEFEELAPPDVFEFEGESTDIAWCLSRVSCRER
jgi:hypothetical protein